MRDYGLVLALAAMASVAVWRPWLGVIALAFFGYLQPHTYAGELARTLPVYQFLFGATVTGLLFTRQRQLPPRDWRVLALLCLWLTFLVSTYLSPEPFVSWPAFWAVSAVLASTLLMLVLIDSERKLLILLAAITASFALVTLKGGYWAVIHGFADRVYGPPNSQYYDNNFFAVAAVMTIPLLVFWIRLVKDRLFQALLSMIVLLSLLAALSSWSRGALLALSAVLLLLAVENLKKGLVLLPIALAALVTFYFLPEQWMERMQSIANYQADGSAQGRLRAWEKGLEFAAGSPLLGIGFDGWSFGRKTLDWHSAYIAVLAEHGFIAFGLWLSLVVGTLASLTRLAGQAAGWLADCARALRAALVAYCIGGAFIGIAYWDLLYHLIAAAILLRGFAAGLNQSPKDIRRPSARHAVPAAQRP